MKCNVLLVLAVILVAVPTAVAKKPPSFALWTASENSHEDSLTSPIVDKCQKVFGHNDRKAGECLVTGLLAVEPKLQANWTRGVARIASGQTKPCRKAIHAYWLAARKNFAAFMGYLKVHQHTDATKINSDITGEPYATLNSLKNEAKSHAIRVCG